jgi:HSP20 family protein
MANRYGLTRYRPFGGLMPFDREMDRFLGHALRWFDWPTYTWRTPALEQEFFAPVELVERDGQTVVKMELPGVEMSDIDITVKDGVLTVKGEKRHEEEVEEGGVYRSERSYGGFSRSIGIPEGLDEAKIAASFDNGVLELVLPRTEAVETKEHKVPVKAKAKTKTRAKKAKAEK